MDHIRGWKSSGVFQKVFEPISLLIALQAGFVIVGITRWGFNVTWADVALALFATVGTEFLLTRSVYFPRGVIASALGIAIFFRASNPLYFAVAGCVAVLSRRLIRTSKRGQLFNASNATILLLVLLFPASTTTEFTQWGGNVYEYLLIDAAILFVAYRSGVLVTTASFLSSYFVLLLGLLSFYPDFVSVHHYGLLGPSLILFASFMITDPKTSPGIFRERVIHGISIALLLFALEIAGVRYSIFLAAFLVTLVNVLSRSEFMMFARRIPIVGHYSNALSFMVAFTALLIAVLQTFPGAAVMQGFRVSPDFLLRGIESPRILQCNLEQTLQPSRAAKFAPYMYTSGAAWSDYDGDGYDDLFVSNLAGPSILYHNNGDGTFSDVTSAVGLPGKSSASAVFADYDNDGRLDLFVAYVPSYAAFNRSPLQHAQDESQAFRVYRNNRNGMFSDVTDSLGLGGTIVRNYTGAAFSFGDYNNDGRLDIVFVTGGLVYPVAKTNPAMLKSLFDPRFDDVTRLVCDAEEILSIYKSFGTRAYGTVSDVERFVHAGGCLVLNDSLQLVSFSELRLPLPHFGSPVDALWLMPGSMHLFENKGGRTFVEHTEFEQQVLGVNRSYTYDIRHLTHPYDYVSRHFFQPISLDYDRDGIQDVFITSGWGGNLLLKNLGDFKFKDVTTQTGVDYAGSGMGVDVGDLDGDGAPDIVTTNVLRDYLFMSTGSGAYTLSNQSLAAQGLGWGVSFLDYDLDGQQDIFIANGDVPRIVARTDGSLSRTLYRTDRLYRNNGNGTFTDVTWGAFCPDSQSGRAVAVSDFDNNGTPDVFVGNILLAGSGTSPDILYVNTTKASYIKVRLQGTKSNSYGVGAEVSVIAGTSTQVKSVLAGSSFYSQNSPRLVFGLGSLSSDIPIQVIVRWPSGKKTILQNAKMNTEVIIRETI